MQDEFKSALERALKKLNASDRFEAEVRVCLSAYDGSVVDEVLAYLTTNRLMSERRTAEQALVARSGKRAVGREKLRADLEKRGAPASVIEGVLPDQEADRERLRELLRAKFPPTAERGKAGRFLFSRGFDQDAIESELDAYLGEPL